MGDKHATASVKLWLGFTHLCKGVKNSSEPTQTWDPGASRAKLRTTVQGWWGMVRALTPSLYLLASTVERLWEGDRT